MWSRDVSSPSGQPLRVASRMLSNSSPSAKPFSRQSFQLSGVCAAPHRKKSQIPVTLLLISFRYFCYSRNVAAAKQARKAEVSRAVEMFSALGNEARVQIVRLLLSAHPQGMVVGEIQAELKIPNSTLSHHLEKLKSCDLVRVRRDQRFLWYTANEAALQKLLSFLFAECCSRNHVVAAEEIVQICR